MKEGFLAVLKFFLFLLLLPLIVSTAMAFQSEVLSLPVPKESWFLWGAGVFVLTFLFVYNFNEVYILGQTIVTNLLKFAQPLVQIGALIIPIYTVLIVCISLLLHVLGKAGPFSFWIIFTLAFSVAMHLVVTAHQLYEADTSPLKSHYLLVFGLAFIANLCIMSLLIGLVIPEYSFLDFFNVLSHQAWASYYKIYRTLL